MTTTNDGATRTVTFDERDLYAIHHALEIACAKLNANLVHAEREHLNHAAHIARGKIEALRPIIARLGDALGEK